MDSKRSKIVVTFVKRFILPLSALVCLLPMQLHGECNDLFEPGLVHPSTLAQDVTELSRAFAQKHNLPVRRIPVGDPKLGRTRLIIPIQVDTGVYREYLQTFNGSTKFKSIAGLAMVEAQFEYGAGYLYAWVRQSGEQTTYVQRHGQTDDMVKVMNQSKAITGQLARNRKTKILALSHPIALDEKMNANLQVYWRNKDARAPLKANNCVDFIPCLELGVTERGATPEQRKFIAHHLGFSRTYSYDEIASRFAHASNEHHPVMFAFMADAESMQSFVDETPEMLLPPHPKQPYSQIVNNYQQEVVRAQQRQQGIQVVQDAANGEPVPAAPVAPPPPPAIEVAMSQVHDGARVFFPIAAGASSEAFDELVRQADRFEKGIDVYMTVNGIGENLLRKAAQTGKIRLHSLFVGQSMRNVVREGLMSQEPMYLSDISAAMRDPNRPDLKFDVVVVRVSPANPAGQYSLGATQDHVGTLLQMRAKGLPLKIIAEVNPNMPFTIGNEQHLLTDRDFVAKFDSDARLAGPAILPLTRVEIDIGMNVASVVPSGSIVQIGIGNLFDGVPDGLVAHGRENIGLRTEMLGDTGMKMMQLGVASYAFTSFAYGSSDLYRWLHGNQDVQFWNTDFVNGTRYVEAVDNFVAINTAVQVDLYGQVNANFGPDGRISSPGGQVEFMMAGHRSRNGRSIMAIRSTAKNETISTISLSLYGPVTTPGEMVSHIVTEYGVAEMVGKDDAGRAVALINIAHPKFRRELFEGAVAKRILKNEDAGRINF